MAKMSPERFTGIKKIASSTGYQVLSALDNKGSSMMRVVLMNDDFRNPLTFKKYSCRDVNAIMSAKSFSSLRLLTKGGAEGFELVKAR